MEAEKRTSMEFVTGGGGSTEWAKMNGRNHRKCNIWESKPFVQPNQGKQIGLPMIQVEH